MSVKECVQIFAPKLHDCVSEATALLESAFQESMTPDVRSALEALHSHLSSMDVGAARKAAKQLVQYQQHLNSARRGGKSKRTLRRVKRELKEQIAAYSAEEQIEVLEGVLASFSSSRGKKRKRSEAIKDSIVESLQHSISHLRCQQKGRYVKNERISMQNIVGAAMSKVPLGQINQAVNLLGLRWHMAAEMKQAWDSYEAGDRVSLHDAKESSCGAYPADYTTFVASEWLNQHSSETDPTTVPFTRRSERAKDDIRNPHSRSDETLYRVHWREYRYCDILNGTPDLRGMLQRGKDKFGPDFHLSHKKLLELEPFEVRKAGDETCVCVHHLKWDKMAGTCGRERKRLKAGCKCNICTNGHECRRMALCSKAEDDLFYRRECIHGECTDCPGFQALQMCEKERELADGVTFRREKWQKGKPQDGKDREVYDFFKVESDFDDLYADMEEYLPTIIEHHDLAWMQDYDWAVTGEDFPPGDFTSVQDFSMSHRHQRRVRHQSLFFMEISTTVYGAVVRVHLSDLSDGYISQAEKERLHAGFEAQGAKPIISITFIAVSPDPTHDNAFVQHFNNKLTEFMASIAKPGLKWRCHHARSDGCKAQYKCADHIYYISRQQAEGKPRMDWGFSCSCHGKDLVDPENGGAKRVCREHENNVGDDDDKSIRTSHEMHEHLLKHYKQPQTDLLQKKMKGCRVTELWLHWFDTAVHIVGIYKREIWYIPASGEGSVNRRIKHCDTLDGSSKLHQFEDIGVPGFVRVRERSCHRCEQCWLGQSEHCSCPDMQHYPSRLEELRPLTVPERAVTRSQLTEEGIEMGSKVVEDDFICIEVDDLQEPWMIGRARGAAEIWPESKGEQYHWMGKVVPGDVVVWVQKLEGVGNTFTLTSKEFPIFVEDIRLVQFKMERVQTRSSNRSATQIQRYKIDSNTKAKIIGSMPMTCDRETKGKVRATFHQA